MVQYQICLLKEAGVKSGGRMLRKVRTGGEGNGQREDKEGQSEKVR